MADTDPSVAGTPSLGRAPGIVTGAPVPRPGDARLDVLLGRCTFAGGGQQPPGEDPPGLHVAVSGGADSAALLALALATGAAVTAHHVDHRLRAESGGEQRFVEELCGRWGAGFRAHRVEVGEGGDLERRCREARRSVLPAGCLTGHTADDQAETVLLRLMRGTGPVGLAAMDPATHPILALRRHETESVCDYLGVRPVLDPMNESGRFTRNRVRSELLPLMHDVAGRDVVPLLARTAELAAQNARALDAAVDEVDVRDPRSVAAAEAPVAAEALRRWWREETDALPPDRAAVDRMIEVARGERRSTEVVGGWRLRRRAGRMWLESAVTPGDR